MPSRGRRITASQVGQYAFCAHAWWLGVIEGYEPANLGAIDAGTGLHERHGWRVSTARRASRLALITFGMAFLFLAIWYAASFMR